MKLCILKYIKIHNLKLIFLRNLVTQMTTHHRPPDMIQNYSYPSKVFNLSKSLTNVTVSAANDAICVAIERTHKFPP